MGDGETDQAYERFLRSSDVGCWLECLRVYSGRNSPDPDDLVRQLILAQFVRWLGRLSDQADIVREASEAHRAAAPQLVRSHEDAPTPSTYIGVGVILASDGYPALGRTYMPAEAWTRPEIAILFKPSDPVKAAAALQPFVTGGEAVFRPAVYRYCMALLKAGALSEARSAMGLLRRGRDDGMLHDALGQLHEQSGQWHQACDVYEQSPWPAHRYRAAVCASIRDRAAGVAGAPAHRSSRRAMHLSATEIDQAGLVQSMAFIEACRWSAFDDWLIHFELGKLAFCRRRHCEAESHLRQAADTAPPGQRFPILRLRFSNLTWMSEVSRYRALPMLPEARAAAREALACAAEPGETPDESDESDIRIWLAASTRETDLLAPVFQRSSHYNRARAHALTGDTAGAVDCWLAAITERYQHRALLGLISSFVSCGLFLAAELLISVIEQESGDDFFVLLELGEKLLELGEKLPSLGGGGDRIKDALSRVTTRLRELGRFDFQNLMRAYQLLSDLRDHHIAEGLLNRAEQIADGAEEHLAVAVARRRGRREDLQEADPRALGSLLRAERESRDRLERLQIAREYFHCGLPGRGRRLLREEEIVDRKPQSSRASLSHIEAIAALQCARWLRREEIEQIGMEAIEALGQDIAAGRYMREMDELLERLRESLHRADESLYLLRFEPACLALRDKRDQARGSASAPPPPASDRDERPGRSLESLVTEYKYTGTGNAERAQEILAVVARHADAATLGGRLALWRKGLSVLDDARARAAVVRPAVTASTPIAENETMLDARTQKLCDLWRGVFHGVENVSALEYFLDEEEQLVRRWRAIRQQEVNGLIRESETWYPIAQQFLIALQNVPVIAHPHFDRLRAAIAEDAQALQKPAVEIAQHPAPSDGERPVAGARAGAAAMTLPASDLFERLPASASASFVAVPGDMRGDPQDDITHVYVSELRLATDAAHLVDCDLLCVLLVAHAGSGSEPPGTVALFAVEESAGSATSGGRHELRAADIPMGRARIPPGPLELRFGAYAVPRTRINLPVIEDIRGLVAALDYLADRCGSLAVAATILDRIDALLDQPRLRRALDGAGSVPWQTAGSYALLPGPSPSDLGPRPIATGGRLGAEGPGDAEPWPGETFALVELGGRRAGGVMRAIDQLRRARGGGLVAESDETEHYWQRDRRLRKTRAMAARFGQHTFWRTTYPAALSISLGPDLGGVFGEQGALRQASAVVEEGLYHELGFRMPPLEFGARSDRRGSYGFYFWGTLVAGGRVEPGRVLVDGTVEQLARLFIRGTSAVNPANGRQSAWIGAEDRPAAAANRLTTWDTQGYLTLHLSAVVRTNCASLFTLDASASLLKSVSVSLFRLVRQAPGGLVAWTTVLRSLLAEEVSIRALQSICEEYLELVGSGPPDQLAEALRNGETLRPYLQKKFPASTPIYELGPNFAAALRHGVDILGGGRVLALDLRRCQDMLAALRAEVSKLSATSTNPVLVVDDWHLRPHLRRLVEVEFPHLAVLARRELSDIRVNSGAGLIEIPGGTS